MSNVFKLVLITFISVLLAGCSTMSVPGVFEPKTSVEVANSVVYPEYPDLPIPAPVHLLPMQVDAPRDLDRTVIKNTSYCLDRQVHDDAFWRECGEHPIINSNIFVGFTQQNWVNLQENIQRLKENNIILRETLEQANAQRREWRELARKERERTRK